jgi:hypothetical protein
VGSFEGWLVGVKLNKGRYFGDLRCFLVKAFSVEWRGKLLIFAAYSADTESGHKIVELRVFEADVSANPVGFTEIVSLDGDCIFISPCSSKSFRSCDYNGVGENLIYFIDGNFCPQKFVYNM